MADLFSLMIAGRGGQTIVFLQGYLVQTAATGWPPINAGESL